jgi:hypothetical protein
MIIKVPVYFQIENIKEAEIDHDTMKSYLAEYVYDILEREYPVKLQGGLFSSKETVKAHFRTPSEVHEILRTKT